MKYLKRFESHEEDYDDDDMMTDEEFKQDVLNQIMELRKTFGVLPTLYIL
jgi:DNA-binding phage protein